MAIGGGLGVLEVPIEVMNARPYLILRMTRRVNAFKTNLTCWLVRKYLIRTLWLQALLTRVLLKIVGEWLILQSRLGGFCSLDAEEGVSFFSIYWNIQVVFEWDSEREFAGRPCRYIHSLRPGWLLNRILVLWAGSFIDRQGYYNIVCLLWRNFERYCRLLLHWDRSQYLKGKNWGLEPLNQGVVDYAFQVLWRCQPSWDKTRNLWMVSITRSDWCWNLNTEMVVNCLASGTLVKILSCIWCDDT